MASRAARQPRTGDGGAMPMPRWLSIEQVAEALGVHDRTVRTYISDGALPVYRIGRRKLWANGQQAEHVAHGLHKGDRVVIVGRWTTRKLDGGDVHLEITAEEIGASLRFRH